MTPAMSWPSWAELPSAAAEGRNGDGDRVGAGAVHVDYRALAAAPRTRLGRREWLSGERGGSGKQRACHACKQRAPAERKHGQS